MRTDAPKATYVGALPDTHGDDATGNQPVIMLCVADAQWAAEALQSACWIARKKAARIVIVAMVPAPHGDKRAAAPAQPGIPDVEAARLETCCATVEDFGVSCEVQRCLYSSLPDAIVGAATSAQANIVFAQLPDGAFPFQRAHRYRALRGRLAELGCDLYVDGFAHVESMFPTYTLP